MAISHFKIIQCGGGFHRNIIKPSLVYSLVFRLAPLLNRVRNPRYLFIQFVKNYLRFSTYDINPESRIAPARRAQGILYEENRHGCSKQASIRYRRYSLTVHRFINASDNTVNIYHPIPLPGYRTNSPPSIT